MNHTKRLFFLFNLPIFTIAVILVFSTVTGFLVLPHSFFFVALLAFGILELIVSRNGRFGIKLVGLFLVFCALSLIINQPPPFFRAWQRLAFFSVIIIIVGPLLVSAEMSEMRRRLFVLIIWTCILLSVGSFICWFLGINFFIRDNEVLAIEVGRFSGLYSHSMLLGPLSSISTIYLIWAFLSGRLRYSIMLVLAILCFAATFMSASRASVGGCFIGVVVTFLLQYKGHLRSVFFVSLLVVLLLIISYPLWSNISDYVIQKQEYNIEAGGTFFSREAIWSIRLAEIRNSPLFGVGFCCVDAGLTFVNTNTGVVEPGSSWLAVFSMTGIGGFITFCVIFFKSFRHSLLIHSNETSLMCGLLSFFAFHMIFEGYVLASGSLLGLLFWLLLGYIWKD